MIVSNKNSCQWNWDIRQGLAENKNQSLFSIPYFHHRGVWLPIKNENSVCVDHFKANRIGNAYLGARFS